ncbi:MAG: hypothetical protein KIT22_09880, partial [Verrucomicrobiae bacterium]|nr:hypothetical protein [Verrucomicrobiae bacterium]
MISTTFDGQPVFLLQEAPDWSQSVQSTHETLTEATASLSNREARRSYAGALRSGLSFSTLAAEGVLRALQGALRSVQDQAIACPFWPGLRSWSSRSTAPIQGGLKLVWKQDWSAWDLYTDTEPGWPAEDDNWAPVLWGTLGDKSRLAGQNFLHCALAHVTLNLVEDGPAAWALQPVATAATVGPIPPSGYDTAPRLLPVRPDLSTPPSQAITLKVERTETGFRRQRPAEFYPQAPARTERLDFLLDGGGVGSLLAFLRDHAGRGSAFWWPSETAATQLTSAVAASDDTLFVTDVGLLAAGDYVALRGATMVFRRVIGVGVGTVSLHAIVGVDLSEFTLVTPLLLVRLEQPKVTLEWTHPEMARTSLSVREVPAEYVPGADETVGETLGALPTRCYLYDFTRDHGGVWLHDRFTSYES